MRRAPGSGLARQAAHRPRSCKSSTRSLTPLLPIRGRRHGSPRSAARRFPALQATSADSSPRKSRSGTGWSSSPALKSRPNDRRGGGSRLKVEQAMKLRRRQFLLAAGAAMLPVCASAQDYPSRPVKIIVGQAAGSASDIVARLVAQFLSDKLGQQLLVEARPGAAGNIATEAVTHMPPDGYSILLINSQNAINVALYEKLNFDFSRDIAPVGMVEGVPLVMEVQPSVPATTVPEFIAYAKANPGKLNMASAGIGGPQHIAGELFKFMAGVDLTH